ncbi:MAG: ATP-binding protein [Candidatus Izemoplasmatales bacterium]
MSDPLLDIPRIYTGIAEWLFSLVYIIYAKKRFTGFKLYASIFGFCAAIIGFQLLAGILPIGLWIPGMVVAFLLMFLFIYCLTNQNIYSAGYVTVLAFVAAEFIASFHWQLYYYAVQTFHIEFNYLAEILLVIIYGGGFTSVYLLETRYYKKGMIIEINQNDLLSFVGIGVMIFTVSNISFVSVNTPISGRYPAEIFYIRSLVDFAGLVILYSQREHKLAVKSRIELNAMESLLNKQYEQYSMSQDSIDIINQKYHDLKNQIIVIRSEKDDLKREKYLEDLENSIKAYEAQYKTGNQVLDTILTSKLLTCIENDITVTCVADGSLLDFIPTMDLCSIFGNALDNAIEGVMKIDDKDKRLIKIGVFSQNDLLLIKIENYFQNILEFHSGNLLTTKKDTRYHGYGLKSIKSIVDKHGGSISIKTDNNWFKLVILMPMTNKE